MPVLPNAKHELFAQELAKGKTVAEAEAASGIELGDCVRRHQYYVYVLIDPRTDTVFYVGKGKGRRAFRHVAEWKAGEIINARKFATIGSIHKDGRLVLAKCLIDGLSERDALDIEYWLINAIGRGRLTNLSSGEQSAEAKMSALVNDAVRRLRPYCRWKSYILPQFDAAEHEFLERTYWDVVGELSEAQKAFALIS